MKQITLVALNDPSNDYPTAVRPEWERLSLTIMDSTRLRIRVKVPAKDDYVTYCAPTSLLYTESGYFQGVLRSTFKEAYSNEVVWEDDEPLVIEIFVGWLTTNTIKYVVGILIEQARAHFAGKRNVLCE